MTVFGTHASHDRVHRYLHHAGRQQREFIDAFGAEVLPGVAA